MMLWPSINTVTFFEGDAASAAALIRDRAGRLLAANPWLAGRLFQAEGSAPLLWVPASEPDPARHVAELGRPALRPDLPLEAMRAEIEAVAVPTGSACLGKDEPLFRVGVLRQEEGRFAVVMSLSHVLGDGNTYYQLYGALGEPPVGRWLLQDGDTLPGRPGLGLPGSRGAGPNGLDPRRRAGFPAALGMALGPAKLAWLGSRRAGLGNRLGRLLKRRHAWGAWVLDSDWVAERKREHARGSLGRGFVSTNDVLTSWFLRRGGYDYGFLAINFRGRIPGLTWSEAGNYEGGVQFWPEEFATPAGVRRALLDPPRFRAGRDDAPGLLASLRGNFGVSTNWASLQTDLELPGCRQVLHLPVISDVHTDGVMIVFRAAPGQLAIALGERRRPARAEQSAGASPLGARLC